MIRIMLVDDEHLIRAGLKSTIEKISAEYQIVAEAVNGYEAKEKISFCQPDIVNGSKRIILKNILFF